MPRFAFALLDDRLTLFAIAELVKPGSQSVADRVAQSRQDCTAVLGDTQRRDAWTRRAYELAQRRGQGLTMAASAAEDVMDLVSDKQGRGRTGEGVEDPLLEQHHKGMFSSQMPRSFFGGGWAMPQAQQQAGVPSLQDRLMARRLGHTVEPAFQQPAQPRAVES